MTYFRVHPSINFARVGNSQEYYLAPETAAGEIIDKSTGLFGGLPIKPGTEDTPITEDDLRAADQSVKRQAARFRLYAYESEQTQYPSNDPGKEIKVGDVVNGKTITDIVWQVHLANKKSNNYTISSDNGQEEGIIAYENGKTPPIRNPQCSGYAKDNNLSDVQRRNTLVIDAGPRALSVNGNGSISFDKTTTPCYISKSGKIEHQEKYPVRFPDDYPEKIKQLEDASESSEKPVNFSMFNPLGEIDTLGDMHIEAKTGRLIVAGGFGRVSGIVTNDTPPNLCDAIDNDGWFDDTSDGPVCATIVFSDGSIEQAIHGWVVCTDPGYAPQTRNVNSTWDDVYDTWVQHLQLQPGLFNGDFQTTYQASFDSDVLPVFHAAFLQRWNTNLPQKGIRGHEFMASISPTDDPKTKLPSFKQLLRKPSPPGTRDEPGNEDGEGVKMPLALGDAQKSFLAVTETQYFLLNQWYDGRYNAGEIALGGGEKLDMVTLANCLGGRYSPGIDLTFIVRDINLYVQDWKNATGPFRINLQPLDYTKTDKEIPFLQEGYVPLRTAKVEPGDLCKFMALPWHTDYNSCATHTPDPNPPENNTLYWSWPAQRPVTVYPKSECTYDSANQTWNLGGMLFSVRGKGTETPYPQQQGRYQCYFDYVENWHKVGFIIQGTQVSDEHGGHYGADKFIEVVSLYEQEGDTVQPWPTAKVEGYKKPENCGPEGAPPCKSK